MANAPSEFFDKLSTYFGLAICWICDTDFPKAKVSFGGAVASQRFFTGHIVLS